MDKCRFLLFSDIHMLPKSFYDPSGRKLDIILEAAKRENVDFMIHAGDFCHGINEPGAREAVDKYNNFEIYGYHAFGNHDTDRSPIETMLKEYRMSAPYYYFECHGIRFIVLSTNYCNVDGKWVHYEFGNYVKHGDSVGYVPKEELDWLRDRLEESKCPCILISHMSFERIDGIYNAEEVRTVIDTANARRKGTVLMCINGHYHTDYMRVLNNVCYLDMNAASYYWINDTHRRYPEKLYEEYDCTEHSLFYDEPPYAIVGISDDMEIDIRGVSSHMFMGVTYEEVTGRKGDGAGRRITANATSTHLRLL